jgi:hypothetical protein
MLRRVFGGAVLGSCLASSLFADFTYEQTSKITGGMMAGAIKAAAVFSKQVREPMTSTVMVKGDRMAMLGRDAIDVIDLNKETMTHIDLQKKTYAVITFADMSEAIKKMAEKVGQKNDGNTEMNFTADVKSTGETKNINGFDTKQTIVTISMEATDKQNGNQGAITVTSDLWLTPSMPGYEEVRNFYKRMAEKMAWTPGGGMLGGMMASQPGAAKGMSKLYTEAAKLDGVPVLQITRMGGTANGQGGPSEADVNAAVQAEQQAQQQQRQQADAAVTNAAGQAAAGAAANKMGKLGGLAGGLGGFGGFGKKKKQQEQPAAQDAPAGAAPPQSGSSAGSLMELTTELTGFSSAPVDAAKLEVPAGFKQVEHDMKKALK